MAAESQVRSYGHLTAPRLTAELSERSILCLPVGSLEQHGPHRRSTPTWSSPNASPPRLAAEAADRRNLWAVPPVPYGLSPKHAWPPGTITLDVPLYAALIDALVGEYARSTPVRALLIVNGHGGNSGALEALMHQLQRAHSIAICVINPSSFATSQRRSDGRFPEFHAGIRETSLMLALVADHVRLDLFPSESFPDPGQRTEIQRTALVGRGITRPWSSDDPALSLHGVIGGDPRQATAAHGRELLATSLHACVGVLDRVVTPIAHEPSDLRRPYAPHY